METPVANEKDSLSTGPLSLLYDSVKTNKQVIISLRNNHKIRARVKAYDRHCNMVLEEATEMWTDNSGKHKNKEPRFRDRRIGKMFLRGDSVVMVVKNINVI